MKLYPIPLAAGLLMLATAASLAQTPSAAASDSHGSHQAAQSPELSEGEITRWDPRTLRVTLRHGEIKNLEMPPMTMVFRVQDATVMGELKPGDKVRFRAEQLGGSYHVTRIENIEKAP